MYRFLKIAFLRCLDDLQFKCIFYKQSGSESESGSKIKVKAGSESGSEKKIWDPQHWLHRIVCLQY
jgi:hypothetical protein